VAGKSPLNVSSLPNQVQTELTSEEFWGASLATLIHEKCKTKIEEVTGQDSVTILSA
jgi:hypothetical protein